MNGSRVQRLATLCCIYAIVVAGGSSVVAASIDDHEVDDEIVVTEQKDPSIKPATMIEILNAYDLGRDLFAKGHYERAFPHLEVAAKGGFKDSQAQLGYLYQNGFGGVKQNAARAIGWFGVAAEGKSKPEYKNHFRQLMNEAPKVNRDYYDLVVAGYIKEFGAEKTRVNCVMHKAVGSNISRLKCQFIDAFKYRDEINAIDAPRQGGVESIGSAPFGG